MFRTYEPYEVRDLRIETVYANLKEREQKALANRNIKVSINEKLSEMGLDLNQFKMLLRKKSNV